MASEACCLLLSTKFGILQQVNAASPSMATVVTNASSLSLPTNGRETRRYLTQMARNSIRADEELLESPFENNGDTNVLTFPQVFQRQARRPVVTSTSARPTSSGTSGFHDQPFYGDGMQGAPCNTQSRTSEVWRCENIMEVARNNVELPMLPLLNHSFEELCWQAQEARHPIVAVLLDPNGPNDLRKDMLRALQRMMAVGSINEAEWLYWGAETSSEEGRKVLGLYVHERVNEDQIILLVPSPHQNPVFVARIQASDANNPGLGSVCERVAMMIQSLVLQREQLAHRREQRTDRKKKDNKSKDEGDAAEVRQKRKKRVASPPPGEDYTKIILRLSGNKKIGRRFRPNALFQEVYDWAGSLDGLPLHFIIRRRQQVVRHSEQLQGHEILDVGEGEEEEITSSLQLQVSFFGNFPANNNNNLSATVVDESQAVGDAEKEEGTKEEDQEEKQEKEKEEEKGVSNEEETLENGDKGGNGGIPVGVVEKEHEEMKGERQIKEKEQGTKKRRRDRRTTAKRKKAKKDPST